MNHSIQVSNFALSINQNRIIYSGILSLVDIINPTKVGLMISKLTIILWCKQECNRPGGKTERSSYPLLAFASYDFFTASLEESKIPIILDELD